MSDKLFSNPRWNQDPGAKVIAKNVKLTEEQKKWADEQAKKWEEDLKKLKEKRNNKQNG